MRRPLLILGLLALVAAPRAWAQERAITGRVVSATAEEPIAGAAVTVQNTRTQTFTDQEGEFSLRVPAGPATLVVRTLGYRQREIEVPESRDRVVVQLETDALALDELVVTGRATSVSRRNLAHAVAKVDAEEMDRAPSATVERSIQGKVAGAMIEGNSGAPGGGMQVRLRGVSTINALSKPLWVVDGVIVSDAEIPSNANAVTQAASGSNPSLKQDAVVNRIADLNPEDIESVEILKGASAAALYGSKASNGVIVVTTKQGRPGQTRFQATQRFGVFDLANTMGLRNYESVDEAYGAFLNPDESTASDTAFIRDQYGDGTMYDLEEQLAGRNELSYETALSMSGGSEDTRYYVSGLWKDDEGIVPNTGFEKQAVRLNLDQSLGDRVEVGLRTNLIHTVAQRGLSNNDNSGTSPYMVFAGTPSFVDLRRRDDGSFPDNPFERSNPLQTVALMENDEDVWRFIAASNVEIEALRRDAHELRIIGTAGVDYFAQENRLFFPRSLQFEPRDGLPGTSLLSNSDNLNLNVNANAVYTYLPEDGSFRSTTSTGVQYEDESMSIARVISRNVAPGQKNIDAGTTVGVRQRHEAVRDMGIYLQEELLALDDRLLLTAGIRGDRSSANGDTDRFFLYPKASASYRFTELPGAFDELKVRSAWGQSGNRPLYGQKFAPLRADGNIGGLPGLVVHGTVGDPNIEPERQNEVEGGLDLAMFDGRGSLELTVYQKNITNLLLERELAPSTGFTTQFFNGGELRTRGVEVAVAATPVRTDRFDWISRATFYADRSKVLHLPVPAFRTGGFGTALGSFEVAEGKSATQIVTNLGLDEDGNVIVGQVGDANPEFRMSFTNDLTFGGFNVYTLVDWQRGGTVVNLSNLLFDLGSNTVDYDQNPTDTTIAGITVSGGDGARRLARLAGGDSRGYFEDASYVKVREASISYTVPDAFVDRMLRGVADRLRIVLSGRNLLTFTDYSGLDPEVSNFGNQPIARNIDVAPFPPSRSIWLSVDVGF